MYIFINKILSVFLKKSYVINMGWILWGCATLFYLYQFILRVSTGVIAKDIITDLQLTEAAFGVIVGGYYCSYSLMQIPLGLLNDRYDIRRLLLGAVGVCILGALILAFADSLLEAFMGRIIIGFGSSAAFLTCIKIITLWFPPSYLPIMTGITVTVGTIGASIGGKPLALLIGQLGWRYSLLSIAIFGSFLFLFILILLFWIVKIKYLSTNSFEKDTDSSLKKPKSLKEPLKIIFQSPQAWCIAIFYFLIYSPLSCIADAWGVSYLCDVYHISRAEAALICPKIYVGVAIGSPLIGWISNKLKSRCQPLTYCTMLAVIVFCAIFYIPNLSLKTVEILFMCLGVLLGGQKLVFTMICELMPKTVSGVAIGFVNSICMLNGVLLPSIIGTSLTFMNNSDTKVFTHNHYAYAFIAPVILLIAALIISFFIKETYHLANRTGKQEKR